GHNDIDGWWMKWGYNYFFNEKNQGRFYLDKLSQKSSDGIGVTHYFKPSATSHWYHDYFYQDNSDLNYPKNDYRLGLGYKNWTRSNLNYETNLVNRHRYTITGDLEVENIYNFYLNGSSPWPNLKLYYRENDEHYNQEKDTYREMRFSNDWSYNAGNSFVLNTSANWYSTEYLKQNNPSQQFIYSLNAAKSWEKSNLRLYYNNARIASGNYFSRNYLPELTYTVSNLRLPLLHDIQSSFQYTNMENVQVIDGNVYQKDTGVRWAADLTKVNNLWKNTTDKWTVNLTHQLRYRFFEIEYDSGVPEENDITALTESLNAGYRFTKRFSTSVGVGYTEKKGQENNDFFNKGDNFLPGGFLSNTWTWSGTTLNANLTARYSFYSDEPEPAYLSATWSPNTRKRVSLNSEYDWEEGIGQSNLNIMYNPNENWRLNLGLGYNPRNETWTQKEFQAFIIQRLNSKLQLEIASVYDIFRNDFGVANTALVYNWHCRDLKFYYDYLEKEYWVMVSFKAFPRASFKLSSNPDDLYNWYLN
ncbi:MAG TPA: hypothetical protein VEC37_10150, partial [Bacillota bacterium]|nr:hypothetical protein [Bacillota bacterium]